MGPTRITYGPLVRWIHCYPLPDIPFIHPVESHRNVKIVELGHWVSPEFRKKGFGPIAVRFIVEEIIFKALRCDVARVWVYVENVGSRKILETAGM